MVSSASPDITASKIQLSMTVYREDSSTTENNKAQTLVVMGCSAGGLKALEEFFTALPSDTGLAYLVVAHRSPKREILLDKLIARRTSLSVSVIRDKLSIDEDCIYIADHNAFDIWHNTFVEQPELRDEASKGHLRIDDIFNKAAAAYKQHTIGILLSGTGTDGTIGIRQIHKAQGTVYVQCPESAEFDGMPLSAIRSEIVDAILKPGEIAERLKSHANVKKRSDTKVSELKNNPISNLLRFMYERTGHDFSSYKASTIRRRIERRMNVHRITELKYYLRFMKENSHEADLLLKELLINVTSFFRDSSAFDALRAAIEPRVKQLKAEEVFRVWVPACSTGEEAYSIAIMLKELFEENSLFNAVQIFATDLDNDAVETARLAKFPAAQMENVSPERQKRFFVLDEGSYRIHKVIREMVIFAPHNILSAPPFTKLDLLSCRNLMIYLESNLQKGLIPLYHYSLKANGILFLGTSETIGSFSSLFRLTDKRWKIYTKLPTSADGAGAKFPIIPSTVEMKKVRTMSSEKSESLLRQIEELQLKESTCPSVIINQQGDIIHLQGDVSPYLDIKAAEFDKNIFKAARENLQLEISSAVRQVISGKPEVIRKEVAVKNSAGDVRFDLKLKKINDPESLRGLFLVGFEAISYAQQALAVAKAPENRSANELELQLQYTREHLQSAIEELESSNEELKSTNEELQSTNEELQSTNEELETSKEEAQSLNEELQTLNMELQSKIEELSQASDDLTSLLNSTDIATIFLDEKLNIKRYTKQARKIINVLPQDIGRSIEDISHKIKDLSLHSVALQVLENLSTLQSEAETTEGHSYFMRAAPYKSPNDNIGGVVITFISREELRVARQVANDGRLSAQITDTLTIPVLVIDGDFRIVFVNQAFLSIFSLQRIAVEGQELNAIDDGRFAQTGILKHLQGLVQRRSMVQNLEIVTELTSIGQQKFTVNARALDGKNGQNLIVLEFTNFWGTRL